METGTTTEELRDIEVMINELTQASYHVHNAINVGQKYPNDDNSVLAHVYCAIVALRADFADKCADAVFKSLPVDET